MGRRPPRVTALSVRCDPAGDAGTVPLSGEPATGGATAMGVRARAGSLITTSLWKVQLEPFCDLPEGPLVIPAAAGDARHLLPGMMFHRAAPGSATAAGQPWTTRPAASPRGAPRSARPRRQLRLRPGHPVKNEAQERKDEAGHSGGVLSQVGQDMRERQAQGCGAVREQSAT